MNKQINSIRGMHDYFSEDLDIWNKLKKIFKQVLNSYSYEEINLPILEKTEIFQRAIGDVTDIIEKEMYSFYDKKGNSLTLRPEGTVGCVRSIIQNNLLYKKKLKFWYLGPMFRYERPQKGRYRQFYQLGVEVFGLKTIDIDLEIILLTNRLWKILGIDLHLMLEINSIGSQLDRIRYQKELVLFLEKNKSFLDEESKKRLYSHPFRILDSKNLNVQHILKKAPLLNKYINEKSLIKFNNLCKMINSYGIKYKYNPNLIRGLDYYNDTVFEWKSHRIGSQNTICAGGRYDSLVQDLGGIKTSAIGFAIGIERLVLLMKSLNIFSIQTEQINIYIIFIGEENKIHAINLSEEIRDIYPHLKIFVSFSNCSLSKKIKHAVESLSRIVILIGSNEIKKKCYLIKELSTQKEFYLIKNELMLKINNIFKK
ncbi:histidine--tRNA ligase [Buchnera aphidicola (Aphis helianthi)]|uniref:Histidine--tRNA ligase n=1 Tax=Buchnera aphidicola (Aphis helianthi) TaxID=2315802 RepID=A0A4D6XQ16_9GAMM|nr:histidine--tRNA ligase [Buchnera aphidicola]QCI17107.1 histidine--tRNA ligase [Buchnera aphidicola (Aphis helianthi)]